MVLYAVFRSVAFSLCFSREYCCALLSGAGFVCEPDGKGPALCSLCSVLSVPVQLVLRLPSVPRLLLTEKKVHVEKNIIWKVTKHCNVTVNNLSHETLHPSGVSGVYHFHVLAGVAQVLVNVTHVAQLVTMESPMIMCCFRFRLK